MKDLSQRLAALSPEKRALLLKRLEKNPDRAQPTGIPSLGRERSDFALSFAQQRLWFMDRMEASRAAYNIPMAWRAKGALDMTALRSAFQALVDRHEPLRTRFLSRGGDPVQQIMPDHRLDIPLVDLSDLSPDEREAERDRLAHEEAQQPFDLEVGPPIRVSVVRTEAEDHLVLITLHHIVTDGWSSGVLIGEFVTHYGAALEKRTVELPPLRIQYADFSQWQRDRVADEGFQAQIDYWLKQLGGLPPLLRVPTDFPRPKVQSFRGAVVPFRLPKDLLERLRALSRAQDATLFMTLLAAFKTLLFRYSGESDIAVGTPLANRTQHELEGLIGLFANTLVMRSEAHGHLTFNQFLAQVRRTTLDGYAHQDVPFEQLVERLNPERSLAHAPLFQMMFVLQNAPRGDLSLPGVAVEPHFRGLQYSKFDLSLSLSELDDGIWGEMEYNTDIFHERTIERVLAHFTRLLHAIAADPDRRLGSLDYMAPEEVAFLTKGLASEPVEVPEGLFVHHLFEDRARSHPDRPALISARGNLSYGELNRAADRLAVTLAARGIAAETPVAVFLERGPDLLVALLAVLKSGGTYIPLDPFYPAQRIATILEDAAPRLVLTQRSLTDALPSGLPHLCLDDPLADEAESVQPAANAPLPNQLAYTIFTSGSTGRPKGVQISHANLAHFMTAARTQLPIDAADTLLAVASVSFDIAGLDFYLTLIQGGRIVIADREDTLDGRRMLATIREHDVTVIQATPPFWGLLMDSLGDGELPRLKALCGGEALNAPLARRLVEKTAGLYNLYGPTETTIWASVAAIASEDQVPLPLGQPVPNYRLYLLDADLNPIPTGAPGELFIGGPGVARGYCGRPGHTAERFIPDPFGGEPGARLYRTGDRCRYEKGGRLVFVGRVDFQVKLRGFRIELGEIEARLLEHPAVKETVVTVIDGGEDQAEKRLVAWLVGQPGPVVAIELRDWAKAALPDYMVPSQFVNLDAFPLTPNGKIDRKALPVPEPAQATEARHVVPRTALETRLTTIWAEVLKVPRVGITDEFFHLGGNSLLATRLVFRMLDELRVDVPVNLLFETLTVEKLAARMVERFPELAPSPEDSPEATADAGSPQTVEDRVCAMFVDVLGIAEADADTDFFRAGGASRPGLQLASRVRERFKFELTLEALFAHPTPRQLAAWLATQEADAKGTSVAATSAEHRDHGRPLPMSSSQLRLWLLDQMDAAGPAYHIPLLLHLQGVLDVPVLERALTALVDQHESLRTVFYQEEGRGYQRILPASKVTLRQVDVRGTSAESDDEALRDLTRTVVVETFDLAEGPLMRTCLFQRGDKSWCLLAYFHHMIADGWSMDLFQNDLWAAYTALKIGAEPRQAEDTAQFADFSLERPRHDEALAWWREHLADLPPLLELPTDQPRPAELGQAGDWHQFPLANDLWRKVGDLAREAEATPYMVLLAAFKLLLARYARRSDIAVGTPVANRHESRAESAFGCFINTLVMRTEIDEQQPFTAILDAVRRTAMDAYAHQEAPFEQIVEAVRPRRSLSHGPLVQVMFALDQPRAFRQFPPRLKVRPERLPLPAAQFDLHLTIEQRPNQVTATLAFNAELFERETVARMARHYRTLLAEICAQPGAKASALTMLSAEERETLLTTWNDTRTKYPQTGLVHDWIREQASRRPEATALVMGDRSLSYGELETCANQLAHHILHGNPAPDLPIGLCAERSFEMVVAMLAILKSGRCWLPLDPELPPARLALMTEDAGLEIVLCQEAFAARLPDAPAQKMMLDGPEAQWSQASSEPVRAPVWPESPAYTIYTSGSTGRPKAVRLSHRALANRLQWMQARFGLTDTDRVLQKTPFSFDVSVWEFLWPLMTGAGLVLAGPGEHRDNPRLIELIRKHGVTTLHFVPPMLQAFLETPGASTCTGLKRVIVSGEALTEATREAFHATMNAALFNLYGPTEAAIDVTCWPATQAPETGPLPIGRPIANTRIFLLDPLGNPVPVGVPGELHIGGIGLADGYRGRPALTAERFVPDPLSGESGARLYRSGDLAAFRPDGDILFLGRTDFQIKLRGFRIELGEIEACLRAQPGVGEAVVSLREDRPGDPRLTAYVTFEAQPVATATLREGLANQLPDYMVPADFLALEGLPLTANGKLDRAALPAPESTPPTRPPFQAPNNDVARGLAEIWESLLEAPRIGLADHFFELGGHSLSAARMVADIQRRFGVTLAMRDLFRTPVLEDLAEQVANRLWLAESRLAAVGAEHGTESDDDLELGEI
ncbi:Amino acid adenylation domain-containing protein [Sulfidibacter corallicola]|uniref:Amino acid adenylation domain-containing protein n=1 Tax=Sulfidibacter corallicola TaxID=2818388 RepID=A0A8A4TGW5_SULCO|nr:non-ribosomal peptide synthetase [Sulfidibacter corallicola]QTD48800.1 amino acid adenylation domain-containing protein [Sulfidibacter corallicola]